MVRKSVHVSILLAASAKSGYIEKALVTIFSYRYHQRVLGWRLFFTDGGFGVTKVVYFGFGQ